MLVFDTASASAASPVTADLFFENGVIYTVDAKDTTAEALAVGGGKIVFVGSGKEGEQYKGPGTKVIDLKGRLMLPGFFDTHIHSPGTAAGQIFDFAVTGIYDVDKVMEVIKDYITAHPEQDSYYGIGYATNIFSDVENSKGPRKERLDAICRDKPVVIMPGDGHAMWLNSKAFEAAGISADTVPPRGGVIEKDEATGALWGTLKDMAMVLAPKPVFDHDKMIAALKGYQQTLNAYGITSVLSLPTFGGLVDVPWEAFHELDANNELTLKVSGAIWIDSISDLAQKEREAEEVAAKYDGKYLKLTTAKFFADGIVNTRTACLLAPYENQPDNYGSEMWDPVSLDQAVAKANEWGLQAHIHAFGDGAVREALDAYQYASAHAPKGDYRNTLTHLMMIDSDDLGRFGQLGVIASIQPYWHFKIPGYWEPDVESAIGKGRADRAYPLKSLFDAGATLSFSSDCPSTVDPNPLVAIEIGVTRNMADATQYGLPDITGSDDVRYLLNPAERLPVKEMIRGFTANGAYATFSEKETGTLEVGKAADLIVLDKNILEIDPLQIEKAKVLQTYLDGKLVYGKEDEPTTGGGSSGCSAGAMGAFGVLGFVALSIARRR